MLVRWPVLTAFAQARAQPHAPRGADQQSEREHDAGGHEGMATQHATEPVQRAAGTRRDRASREKIRKIVSQCADAGIARRRFERGRTTHDGSKITRQGFQFLRRQCRRSGLSIVRAMQRGYVPGVVGCGQHVKQSRQQEAGLIDVRSDRHRFAAPLFRARIAGCQREAADQIILVGQARDAEIEQLYPPALIHEHIGRFDIAMNQQARMRERERLAQRKHELQPLGALRVS